MYYLAFALKATKPAPPGGTPLEEWPRLLELSFACVNMAKNTPFLTFESYVKPMGFDASETRLYHGITDKKLAEGKDLAEVVGAFHKAWAGAQYVVGYDTGYMLGVMDREQKALYGNSLFSGKRFFCLGELAASVLMKHYQTKGVTQDVPRPAFPYLHQKLVGGDVTPGDTSLQTVYATMRVFLEMLARYPYLFE